MLLDLLIILFIAAMAVGWSLAAIVFTLISVSDYFDDRRMRAWREKEARERP